MQDGCYKSLNCSLGLIKFSQVLLSWQGLVSGLSFQVKRIWSVRLGHTLEFALYPEDLAPGAEPREVPDVFRDNFCRIPLCPRPCWTTTRGLLASAVYGETTPTTCFSRRTKTYCWFCIWKAKWCGRHQACSVTSHEDTWSCFQATLHKSLLNLESDDVPNNKTLTWKLSRLSPEDSRRGLFIEMA